MGAPRLILHVGRQKTGTTALQRVLHHQRMALLQRGVLYPEAGRKSQGKMIIAHHPLAAAVRHAPDQARVIFEEIRREWQRHDCHTVILSSESFLNLEPELLANLLLQAPERLEVLVIGYLRNPFQFCLSSYAQRVQASHYSGDLATWVITHGRGTAALIERWCRTFPGMRWTYYQRKTLRHESVVDDFLHKAELAGVVAGQVIGDGSLQPVNPSIGGNLLWIKQRLNEACLIQSVADTHYTLFGELALHERFRGQAVALSPSVMQGLIGYLLPEMEAIAASGVVANAPLAAAMMREARRAACWEIDHTQLREDLNWLRQQPIAATLLPLLAGLGGVHVQI